MIMYSNAMRTKITALITVKIVQKVTDEGSVVNPIT